MVQMIGYSTLNKNLLVVSLTIGLTLVSIDSLPDWILIAGAVKSPDML
jgi:hypothetical protein